MIIYSTTLRLLCGFLKIYCVDIFSTLPLFFKSFEVILNFSNSHEKPLNQFQLTRICMHHESVESNQIKFKYFHLSHLEFNKLKVIVLESMIFKLSLPKDFQIQITYLILKIIQSVAFIGNHL